MKVILPHGNDDQVNIAEISNYIKWDDPTNDEPIDEFLHRHIINFDCLLKGGDLYRVIIWYSSVASTWQYDLQTFLRAYNKLPCEIGVLFWALRLSFEEIFTCKNASIII